MTKKLEELFDLPQAEDDTSSVVPEPAERIELTAENLSTLEKVESALPAVRGLEASDREMDELADLAKQNFQELISLGMNVEARFSSEILSVASQFLGHAITAKTAKMNKKIKMIELQLKKAKLDQDSGEGGQPASGTLLDRNELLEKLLKDQTDATNK